MNDPGSKRKGGRAAAALTARVLPRVTLRADQTGRIFARFDRAEVNLGAYGSQAARCVEALRGGLALDEASSHREERKTVGLPLARRLATHGLLEYHLGRGPGGGAMVVVEPQMPDYWPRMAPLDDAGAFALSRFAFLRRRGTEMVLESPRASALFKLCDLALAAAIATLAEPRPLAQLRRLGGFPGDELLALLVDSGLVHAVDLARSGNFRRVEGDDDLVLWDFHDLLFHARSTEGRHANPTGGLYPYLGVMQPLPALRPRWPGKRTDLCKVTGPASAKNSPLIELMRARCSTRVFDAEHPITLTELAQFLDHCARVHSKWKAKVDYNGDSTVVEYAGRPYPSAGGCYELEIYLSVDRCEGLARGFYHYDAGQHALVPINARLQDVDALLDRAEYAMGAPAKPQILITITARFGRVSWKYSSIAYSLILKDVGALMQTFYLMATEMGLGGCAIGSGNIDHFARMTGIEFHVEGPVGQFAIGRGAEPANRQNART